MFNDLIKIEISIQQRGTINHIIIDNSNKSISLNDILKENNSIQYNEFLMTFFRIIREWKNEYINKSLNDNYILNITVVEKENKYSYKIQNAFPNNFDSFISLIEKMLN